MRERINIHTYLLTRKADEKGMQSHVTPEQNRHNQREERACTKGQVKKKLQALYQKKKENGHNQREERACDTQARKTYEPHRQTDRQTETERQRPEGKKETPKRNPRIREAEV
jgi:hypothetical protein